MGAFSLCVAVRFLCVAGPYRGCTTYYARMYTVMAVFRLFRVKLSGVFTHGILRFERILQQNLGTEGIC